MRRRLAGVLAAEPLPLPYALRGRPGGRHLLPDASDLAMHKAREELRDAARAPAMWTAFPLFLDWVSDFRTPWSGVWEVEALARGRIRRWARWEVDGVDATRLVIGNVAAALGEGRIPEPEGAVLVEVVDQRPARSPQ